MKNLYNVFLLLFFSEIIHTLCFQYRPICRSLTSIRPQSLVGLKPTNFLAANQFENSFSLSIEPINITLDTSPTKESISYISKHLREHNRAIIGEYNTQEVLVTAKNSTEQIVAGGYGFIKLGWLYIDLLWVSEHCRKTGLGTKILSAMEDLAFSENIRFSRLNTGNFQGAVDFYKKHGYKVFAQIDVFPENAEPGHKYIDFFMKKDLAKVKNDDTNLFLRLKNLLSVIKNFSLHFNKKNNHLMIVHNIILSMFLKISHLIVELAQAAARLVAFLPLNTLISKAVHYTHSSTFFSRCLNGDRSNHAQRAKPF